jgi:signal peptidase I
MRLGVCAAALADIRIVPESIVMPNKVKQGLLKFWRNWVKPLVVVLIVLGAFRSAVADWNDVPTGSMKPTILEGDRIVVNKLAYDLKVPFTNWRLAEWGGPQRGDIVICFSPEDGQRLVKRVIGLPGDTVAMRGNRLIINGEPVSYGPITPDSDWVADLPASGHDRLETEDLDGQSHPIMITPGVPSRHTFDLLAVPEGHYLVLGDNRDQSRDSRYFGFVPRDQIAGEAFGVAFSLDQDHFYRPRWDRLFKGLD